MLRYERLPQALIPPDGPIMADNGRDHGSGCTYRLAGPCPWTLERTLRSSEQRTLQIHQIHQTTMDKPQHYSWHISVFCPASFSQWLYYSICVQLVTNRLAMVRGANTFWKLVAGKSATKSIFILLVFYFRRICYDFKSRFICVPIKPSEACP